MKQVDEVVEEILAIVNTLNEHGVDSLSDDTTSRIAVKTASLKASLGESVADAKKIAWDAEAEYQKVRAEGYKRLRDEGKGSTDADELKRLAAHEAFMAWNQAKYQAERLNNLSANCHDLIDSLKSRLIHRHTERQESDVF